MTIPIRLARPEDAPACAAIVSGWIARTPWLTGPPDDALLAMIAEGMAAREVWVAGEPVAGYLSFNPEASQVMGLYCKHSGQGIGKALMDRVKMGRDFLQLRSHAPNAQAHRFYRREGFVQVGQTAKGTDGVAEIHMEWRR